MAIFEKVEVVWNGETFTIPANRVLRCIADVEDELTLAQLSRYLQSGNPPLAKLSRAFALVLRHAGAKASEDDVYAALFKDGDQNARALEAIYTLQVLMIPPEHLRAAEAKLAAASEKKEPGSSPSATGSSSAVTG